MDLEHKVNDNLGFLYDSIPKALFFYAETSSASITMDEVRKLQIFLTSILEE